MTHFPGSGGLRKVVWCDAQTEGNGDSRRKGLPWVTWCSFWNQLENVGLQKVAFSDPQTDGYSDERRVDVPGMCDALS